mmetsp:Transcript_8880/g.27327  ORF Transcript_8880/g.27327 Transcript_8880/m.27327 type:complete len:322 (-) Transcript_8880:41-1006(-)
MLEAALRECSPTATSSPQLSHVLSNDDLVRYFARTLLELAPEGVAMLMKTEKRIRAALAPVRGILNDICFPNLLDLALFREDVPRARRLLEEAVDRLGRDVRKIHDRLRTKGYDALDTPFDTRTEPYPTVQVPLVLDVVWKQLGGLHLSRNRSHVDFLNDALPDDDRRSLCSDVLSIASPASVRDRLNRGLNGLATAHLFSTAADDAGDLPPPFIPLALDIYRKDGVVGGPPEGVRGTLDPLWGARDDSNDVDAYRTKVAEYREQQPVPRALRTCHYPRPPTLLNYLRKSVLDGGGFPGFLHNTPGFDAMRRDLTADLEPF